MLRELPGKSLKTAVYPTLGSSSTYRFTHRDGTRSTITSANSERANAAVVDTTENKPVTFERESKTSAICFALDPRHNYKLRDRK